MKRTFLVMLCGVVCVAAAAACGDDAATPSPVAEDDGGDENNNDVVEPQCAVAWESGESALEVGEGALVELAVDVSGEAEGTPVVELPDGWELWAETGEGQWTLRAPYNPEGLDVTLSASVVCAGGETVAAQRDVSLRRLQWRALEIEGEIPPAREHPHTWFDPEDPTLMYMFGGFAYEPQSFTPTDDLWRLDLETLRWEAIPQEGEIPRFGGGRHAIGADGELLLFGGDVPRERVASTSIYALSVSDGGGVWRERAPSNFNRSLGAVVYDAPRDRFVSVCGLADGEMDCEPTVWSPESERWTTLSRSQAPADRYGFFYGHDVERGRLVVASGAGRGTNIDPVNPHEDAWLLDLSQDAPVWTEIETEGTPAPGRRNGCGGWDQASQRLFVWGGTPDARTASAGLYVLNLNEDGAGARWVQVMADEPPPRASCLGAFDANAGRLIVGYGNSNVIYEDLWALEL